MVGLGLGVGDRILENKWQDFLNLYEPGYLNNWIARALPGTEVGAHVMCLCGYGFALNKQFQLIIIDRPMRHIFYG